MLTFETNCERYEERKGKKHWNIETAKLFSNSSGQGSISSTFWYKNRPLTDPIKLFLFANEEFFSFFATLFNNQLFFICNKHTSLTLKSGKQRKTFL